MGVKIPQLWKIHQGDVLEVLRGWPDGFVQCVVTSPPYYGLRDYGTAEWEGGDAGCDHAVGRFTTSVSAKQASNHGSGTIQAKDICPKCGAKRVDLQGGLEETPEQHIAWLVEVLREVRRVLRDDGVVWLNYGDAYAGGARGSAGASMKSTLATKPTAAKTAAARESGSWAKGTTPGLKPKDLLMMPARVALALQQPYYTGRIKREQDRIWLAAMLEAEGCLFIHKRKKGQHNGQGYHRQNASFGPGIEIANTSKAIIDRVMEIAGQGSICSQGPETNQRRKQTIYRWNLRTTECRELVRELYPHLVGKQQQARILCGCPSSGHKADAAHAALIGLHNGVATDVDFSAPAPCWEPGWWVRSDVIWSKANPMPESVHDRPTRSHETVYLLAKRPRYFYDADAVREAHKEPWRITSDLESHGPKERVGASNLMGRESHREYNPLGRNLRDVWAIATQPYPGTHFATFPEKLVEPCIKAGTSEKGACPLCGTPWARVVAVKDEGGRLGKGYHDHEDDAGRGQRGVPPANGAPSRTTLGWKPSCLCGQETGLEPRPCIVLDPFAGSGTVGVVAGRLGRAFIGIDLAGGDKDLGGHTANQRIEAARRGIQAPLAELSVALAQEDLFE